MPEQGQQFMWVMVFFDLPVVSDRDKRNYQQFRKYLLRDGFTMVQFSIYSRLCNGIDTATAHITKMEARVPPRGSIRVMTITDRQYSRIRILVGTPTANEKFREKPQQLLLL